MKKASQAAGRPVRTLDDRGAIIFLDYRFSTNYCRSFLPLWVSNHMKVLQPGSNILSREIREFFKA
jgi:Rad3-related DNA helicase